MTTDLNTLLTALYVKIDDYLGDRARPGRPPKLSDAELLTLAVARSGLVRRPAGYGSYPALPGAFPCLPRQSGYNKRLRSALSLIKRLTRVLVTDTDLWDDPVWIVDSTPVDSSPDATSSTGSSARCPPNGHATPVPTIRQPAPQASAGSSTAAAESSSSSTRPEPFGSPTVGDPATQLGDEDLDEMYAANGAPDAGARLEVQRARRQQVAQTLLEQLRTIGLAIQQPDQDSVHTDPGDALVPDGSVIVRTADHHSLAPTPKPADSG